MKKRLLKNYRILSIAFFTLLLNSCAKAPQSKNKPQIEKKNEISVTKTIGFSIDTLAIERWQRDLDVFMNKARELGVNVIVQNAGNNLEEQNRQLQYLIDRNVDVIVLLPLKDDGFTETLQKIKNKNIPVISYDRLTRNADIDLYITIDSQKVGEIMARGMIKETHGSNWYCILGAKEDYNMNLIMNGIYSVIHNTDYYIGHIFYTSGWNYDLAYEEMLRLLKNNSIPDAIICGNDAIADSVISAINVYSQDLHIPICGQDADIAACQNIIQKKQSFTVYKPITKLAEITAEYAVRLAKGEAVSEITSGFNTMENGNKEVPVLMLEPEYVNADNIDKIIIDSGFHTKAEVYNK